MLYDKKWDAEVKIEPWRLALLEAADIIEKGWCRGVFRDGDKFCAMGALQKVTNFSLLTICKTGEERETYVTAMQYLTIITGNFDIVDWNDHVAKDASEVAAKMREAAKHDG